MELRYSHDHQWVRRDAPGRVTVGLSDFAQRELGAIAYLELPRIGAQAAAGSALGAVESLKSAGELYAPVSGTVVACNERLANADGRALINRDPLGAGWIFVLEMADPAEFDQLLSGEEYARLTADDG